MTVTTCSNQKAQSRYRQKQLCCTLITLKHMCTCRSGGSFPWQRTHTHAHTEHCAVGGSGLSSSSVEKWPSTEKMCLQPAASSLWYSRPSRFSLLVYERPATESDWKLLKELLNKTKKNNNSAAGWQDERSSIQIWQQTDPVAVQGWQINDGPRH